jgi:hypothetical protein
VPLDVYKDWLGIPDGPRPPDHYALLRLVQFEDDFEKVRKNYKKLNGHVRKYATGQYGNQSQDLLNEMAKAMLCLTDLERKQEYDRSLGRVTSDVDEETGRRPLTAYLQDEGLITPAQAVEIKTYSDKSGLSMRDAVVQMKLANQEQATRALAAEHGIPYVDLAEVLPDDSILDKVPRSVVRRHTCLPLFIDDNAVLVASGEEPSHELEDEIRLRFGLPLRAVLAAPLSINQCIAKYYAAGMRKEASESTASAGLKGGSSSGGKKVKRTLSDEEKQEQKNLGLVIICMTIAGLNLLDTFVLWDKVYKFYVPAAFSWLPIFSTVFIGLPICFIVYTKMVQPNQK